MSAKVVIAGAIVAAHVMLIGVLGDPLAHRGKFTPADELIASAQLIVESPAWDPIPASEVRLQSVPLHLDAIEVVRIDDSMEDQHPQILGPASAPRPSPVQSIDATEFARRAGLQPGQAAAVVLSVQVGADGTARSVDISRSSGIAAADAAAIDYALALRWIPGTLERAPHAMRILLPVTLVVPY